MKEVLGKEEVGVKRMHPERFFFFFSALAFFFFFLPPALALKRERIALEAQT